jgi:mercuric reductase
MQPTPNLRALAHNVSRHPVVPDRSHIQTALAGDALNGILEAAGWYAKRFDDLSQGAASTLAVLLRLYAALGRPPSRAEIALSSQVTEAEVERQLNELTRQDLIVREDSGATIVGAYPFTEATTRHTVKFAGSGRTLNTMCAIDALGAGAMCRDDVLVASACHHCGVPVVIQTKDRGNALLEVHPREAVVWTGFRSSCGCAAETLCTELIFLCSDEHLERWRKSGAASEGLRLSLDEGIQVGKALFADRALWGG